MPRVQRGKRPWPGAKRPSDFFGFGVVESPLAAVGMGGEDPVDGVRDFRIIFRMMAEEDVTAGGLRVFIQPGKIRLGQTLHADVGLLGVGLRIANVGL